jgi:hypothetical protein
LLTWARPIFSVLLTDLSVFDARSEGLRLLSYQLMLRDAESDEIQSLTAATKGWRPDSVGSAWLRSDRSRGDLAGDPGLFIDRK